MKKVAIVIEGWKLKIFSKTLIENGYEYTKHDWTKGLLVLRVKTDDIAKLQLVVREMANKAKRLKLH